MNRLLPTLLATITQHPRHQVMYGKDFKWSKSNWTHNVFRVYELIFWRRCGSNGVGDTIRREGSANAKTINGRLEVVYTLYTWEAFIAYVEARIRSLFRVPDFEFVKIPEFAYEGVDNSLPKLQPIFSYAIAYGGQTSDSGASPRSTSLTTSGSNITISAMGSSNAASTTISGMTFNSVAFTKNGTQANTPSSLNWSVWVLPNASAATANVVTTLSGQSVWLALEWFTGTSNTQYDKFIDWQTATGSPGITSSITTVANNAWTMMLMQQQGGVPSNSTNCTIKETTNGTLCDSNAAITPAGLTTVSMGACTGTCYWAMASIAPVAGASTVSPLTLLGAG